MSYRKLVLMVSLVLSATAQADIVTVVNAVETITSNISVPTSTNGRLMFRPCDEQCDEKFISTRLTPETRFVMRGETMSFEDFRNAFLAVRNSGEDYALVSYNVETSNVVRISIGF